MKAVSYIVTERYGNELFIPSLFKTLQEAEDYVRSCAAGDLRGELATELGKTGCSNEAVLNYAKSTGVCREFRKDDKQMTGCYKDQNEWQVDICYRDEGEWHEFKIDRVEIDLERNLAIEGKIGESKDEDDLEY